MTMPKTGGHPDLKLVNPNAAVNPDTDTVPVRAFGAFTQDVHDLTAWFRSCDVTSVAMQT